MDRAHWTSKISRRAFLGTAAFGAIAATGSPPARAFATNPLDSPPYNIRVSGDDYNEHAEPSLAVNPRDQRNLLGACMSWYTGSKEVITTYASFDGGRSWRSNGALPLPPNNTMFADDVSVAFDRGGRGFVCAMAPTGPERTDRGIYLWWTDDGGLSFTGPIPVTTQQFVDHPWLAIAPDRGNIHTVWVASEHQALGYSRSLDGGATFDPARAIPAVDGTKIDAPMVAAGRDGLVAAIYAVGDQGQSQDPDAEAASGDAQEPGGDTYRQIEVVCSTDAGQSFETPVMLGTSAFVVALEGDVNPNSSPAIAAAPHRQALYAAFVTHDADTDHSDVMVTASFDRGTSWRTPVAATPRDHRIYFQPQLAIDPTGRVALSAFALADGRVDTVLFTSPAEPLCFGPPLTITSRSFDPSLGGPGGKHGAWWIGDYQGLASSADSMHLLWNDTRPGTLQLFTAAVPSGGHQSRLG
jgi:hypothetical protein